MNWTPCMVSYDLNNNFCFVFLLKRYETLLQSSFSGLMWCTWWRLRQNTSVHGYRHVKSRLTYFGRIRRSCTSCTKQSCDFTCRYQGTDVFCLKLDTILWKKNTILEKGLISQEGPRTEHRLLWPELLLFMLMLEKLCTLLKKIRKTNIII
jgi:hypothetical protein